MALISAARFNALKKRVKAECLRRQYVGSVSAYGGSAYDYASAPAAGRKAAQEHRVKLAVPLNAIHAGKTADTSGAALISDSDLAEMESFVSSLESRSLTDRTATDCAGSCTGTCTTGCATGCYTGCTGSCTGSCTGNCSGCSGTCSGGCSGDCTGDCYAACADDCSGDCGSGCSGGCSGDCTGGCDGCSDGCTSSCFASCDWQCDLGMQ